MMPSFSSKLDSKTKLILTCCVLSRVVVLTSSQKIFQDAYVDLQQYIQNCSSMKHKLRPGLAGQNQLDIYFDPFQIQYVDEVRQNVKVSFLLIVNWTQPDCQWDPEDFSGICFSEIESTSTWIPKLLTPKSTVEAVIDMPSYMNIKYFGTIEAIIPTATAISCHLDLEKYPFDRQNCSFIFIEKSGMAMSSLKTSPLGVNVSLQPFFGTSAEWDLLNHGCGQNMYANYPYIECWFIIERRSLFYVATIIFPIALMSVMTLVVFCIPAESGEKMSFVVAIFVSMTVFINFVVDVIPRSIDKLPRIVALIMIVMIIIGLAAVAASAVLKKHREEEREKEKRGQLRRDNSIFKEQNKLNRDKPACISQIPCQAKDEVGDKESTLLSICKTTEMTRLGSARVGPVGKNKVDVVKEFEGTGFCESGENEVITLNRKKRNVFFFTSNMEFHGFTHTQLDKIFFGLFLLGNIIACSVILFA